MAGSLPASLRRSLSNLPIATYVAGFCGSVMLGLADLLRNGDAATVNKLGEVIRTTFAPRMESPALMALFALASLGVVLCWIHQPTTRIDAFARGLSVFAVLSAATPYSPPSGNLDEHRDRPTLDVIVPEPRAVTEPETIGHQSQEPPTPSGHQRQARSWSWLSTPAFAQVPAGAATEPEVSSGGGEGTVVVRLALPNDAQRILVTLRDPRTATRLGSVVLKGESSFSMTRAPGSYLLEVEGSGLRRSHFTLPIVADETRVFSAAVDSAALPSGVQRLFSSQSLEVELVRVVRSVDSSDSSFAPISIFTVPSRDVLISVSRNGVVYVTDPRAPRIDRVGRLALKGSASDHCFVEWKERSWIASTSRVALANSEGWLIHLTLTPIDLDGKTLGATEIEGHILRRWLFSSIAFDRARERLVLAEPETGSVRSVDLASLAREPAVKTVVESDELSQPVVVAVREDYVYIGDSGRKAVLAYRLSDKALVKILDGIEVPRGVSLSEDGKVLVVANEFPPSVVEYDVPGGLAVAVLDSEVGLKLPSAVAQSRSGDVWVAEPRRLLRISRGRAGAV